MARLKPKPMDDHQLKAVINAEVVYAMGFHGGELSEQRRTAMELYYGEPLGNEVEGRSQVVLSDTMDTVEWIMPALMRIFFAGNDICKFDPVGVEDEDLAAQKTDYCNHVFMKDNDGFLTAYDWIKDGLLQKTGVLKCVWDDTPIKKRSTHTGLNVLDLAQLLEADDGEEIEVVEQREYEVEDDDYDGPDVGSVVPMQQPMPPQGMAPVMGRPPVAELMENERTRFDVTIIRTQTRGRVKIVAVPPEEFLISRRATDTDSATFTGHRYKITVSEAPRDGLRRGRHRACGRPVRHWRVQRGTPGTSRHRRGNGLTRATRSIRRSAKCGSSRATSWLTNDGDGITERRQIIVAGENNSVILSNEVVDDHPWIAFSPIRIPHKFHGLGMADFGGRPAAHSLNHRAPVARPHVQRQFRARVHFAERQS